MKSKLKKIQSLVDYYYDELDQRGYSQETKWRHGKICKTLLEWCTRNNIEVFNEDIGIRFCDETINGHLSNPTSSHHYRRTLRVVRMLISLQRDGDFEFRSPRIEYKFKMHLKDIIEQYLYFCAENQHMSKVSIYLHKLIIYRFDEFLFKHNISEGDVSIDLFEEFFSSDHCSKSSRYKYKSILRNLYRYMFDMGILDNDYSTFILKEPKISRASKLPSTYSVDEIKQMIKAVDRSSAKGKRDYLVLLLAAEYGWRSSDITAFSLDQIDWDKNKIIMVQSKTGGPVEFPLLASVGNAIIDYLQHGRPQSGGDVIIVNHENTYKGKKLKSPTIHSIVSKAMQTANIQNWKEKKHGPHSLRHSLATNMLKQNVPIPIISTVLGHQSTETTKIYLKVDINKLKLCSLPIPELKSSYYNIK